MNFFEKSIEQKQKEFIEDHHHLISPWRYSEAKIKLRTATLMRRNWPKQETK